MISTSYGKQQGVSGGHRARQDGETLLGWLAVMLLTSLVQTLRGERAWKHPALPELLIESRGQGGTLSDSLKPLDNTEKGSASWPSFEGRGWAHIHLVLDGQDSLAETVSSHFTAPWATPRKLGVGQRGRCLFMEKSSLMR